MANVAVSADVRIGNDCTNEQSRKHQQEDRVVAEGISSVEFRALMQLTTSLSTVSHHNISPPSVDKTTNVTRKRKQTTAYIGVS